jgi:S1-C subfamily serine protease
MRARPLSLALVALLSALVGGAVVLAVASSAGWLGRSSSRTIVVRTPPIAQAIVSKAPLAKPLLGNGFNPAGIYRSRVAGVVTIFAIYEGGSGAAQEAQGSGFVVSRKGYVLTNSHVITNAGDTGAVRAASRLYVEFQDGDRVPAKIVGWDVFDDVGVIKIDPSQHALKPVPLGDSRSVVVGEPVAAIGSPFGNENSITVGVVSATHRAIRSLTSEYNLVDAIQTDAPINHGNSGGPLFDARGRVIGINAQIRSDSGTAEGVGFAVPIDSAKRSLEQLVAAGHVLYAYVGITTEDLIPAIAKRLRYPVTHGAVIASVRSGSPGAVAGLRGGNANQDVLGTQFRSGGDVIVGIDGVPVRSAEDVVRVVAERLSPGDTARFTIVRDGERRQVAVKLGERPATPQ